MNLENIVIVLDRPEESRNIGAVCRAMANNGIHCLRLVARKETIDDMKVRILAIHASAIWDNVVFFDSIQEATADCVIAAGTTRRRGKKRKGKLLLPEELTDLASTITGSKNSTQQQGKIAVVFGNERTGLTDDEMLECTLGVTIPSSDEFASLNLSHAVQIICYHLFRKESSPSPGYTPVPLRRLDTTVTNITDNLRKIGFFSVTGQADMTAFWRTILSRAALSEGEAQYIEKIFDKAAGLASRTSIAGEQPETQSI
jgi:tRNA/rRNA methyltransferase